MKKHLAALQSADLFRGIAKPDLESLLVCLGAEIKKAHKNESILHAGEKPVYVGLALSGRLHIVREDFGGNSSLISAVTPGEMFSEAICCAGVEQSPFTVLAVEPSDIMLLRFRRILNTCERSCLFHQRLIENMLKLVAKKTLFLQSRMEIMCIKSVRGRALRLLESYAQNQDKRITLPFNRQEMADYLGVERSALSHELSKMKRDGLIDYKKNKFILI